MVYLRNRYYKINEGRFTQEDPARDGLNWYAYCGNNSVNFVDPFGLDPGDLFESEDLVALDFAMNYAEISATEVVIGKDGTVYVGREYASIIYSVETEDGIMYSYTEPAKADVDGKYGQYGVETIELEKEVEKNGNKVTGDMHTHYPDGSLSASGKDKSTYKRYSGKNYLILPTGRIRVYI